MKKMVVLLCLLACSIDVAQAKLRLLTVKLLNAASYQCTDNTKLQVRYYSLSDNSLDFVKVKLNGKIYTLPQAVSASGAKYSDGHELTWWTKGDEGTVFEQNGGPEQDWPATHTLCKEVKAH